MVAFTLIPAALIVVLASAVDLKKETPFEFPFLTFAYKSRSFFLPLWGVGLMIVMPKAPFVFHLGKYNTKEDAEESALNISS